MKRPFRGLRRRPPRPRYDAVVVGAGIGGLIAANLLAREGLAVLLVERHYMAGGFCSSFRRGGYTFDASTHFYPLLGNSRTLTGALIDGLGVETGWVKMDPVDTFHFPDGSRFEVPADLDDYLAAVRARFPHQAEALDRFFADVREAYVLGLVAYFGERETPRLARFRDWTLTEALERHFDDPELRLLLTADCPHWGSSPSSTSFVFDSMLRLSYFLGNYYPVGGSQAFADELARRFEERGGEILMSTAVDRVEVGARAEGGGRFVRAVEMETLRGPLAGRHRVEAATVVANVDLASLVERLVGAEAVGDELATSVLRLRPTWPCFLTHLGLEGVDPAAIERAQGYWWSGWDADRVGRDALVCKVFSPTLYDPGLAPPGGQIVILQKVLEMDPAEVTDWTAHKAEVEAFVTAQLERVLPGVGERTVVRHSASAATAERFTGNRGGAMLGWEMSPGQLGAARPGIETPVAGLFLCGHWTRPGGGITPVIVSAVRVAERITGSRLLHATPHPVTPGRPRRLESVKEALVR
ncbi:MAG TPA: NAD(P)/FAD-dependent oxidoreductase [Thermoanaerobaculia bacterium]|nr:NAD(P)/FAD-dependent oxidoreductase [Thermoanaerobaculia bacterium]